MNIFRRFHSKERQPAESELDSPVSSPQNFPRGSCTADMSYALVCNNPLCSDIDDSPAADGVSPSPLFARPYVSYTRASECLRVLDDISPPSFIANATSYELQVSWDRLPQEILKKIVLGTGSARDVINAWQVCKAWASAASNDLVWGMLCHLQFRVPPPSLYNIATMRFDWHRQYQTYHLLYQVCLLAYRAQVINLISENTSKSAACVSCATAWRTSVAFEEMFAELVVCENIMHPLVSSLF